MPPSHGAIIRHSTPEDIPTILELILELADYEREIDAVKATPQMLHDTIAFDGEEVSSSKPARTLLLVDASGTVAGMALYFYNYSTWRARPGIYLEDLYVRKSERGNGYGQRLLKELAKEVVEMGGGRLEWSVLKWNKPSIGFYESLGAIGMDGWTTMRVDGESLKKLAANSGE